MSRFKLSRRELLAAAATTAFASTALARESSSAAVTKAAPAAPRPRLALIDSFLADAELASARAMLAPLQPRVLESDLVWEWRRELGPQFAKGLAAVAITRWDKALLLSELAREAALPVRQRQVGRSMFQTEIG
jgi:hypothetical protein